MNVYNYTYQYLQNYELHFYVVSLGITQITHAKILFFRARPHYLRLGKSFEHARC